MATKKKVAKNGKKPVKKTAKPAKATKAKAPARKAAPARTARSGAAASSLRHRSLVHEAHTFTGTGAARPDPIRDSLNALRGRMHSR